jgi:2-dehydro-3-deoxyphosphogluconate aldolase/(4S)-4-hydroxy-2-oxoglutarate aldolase
MAGLKKLSSRDVMQDAPVIPVIVVEDIKHAVPMARALLAGGIKMLEVTLRTKQGLEAIRAISNEVPQVFVGAGTVRTPDQALLAFNAGAQFAVSPGFTTGVAVACKELGLALLPGVSTASEVMLAQEHGFNELKFFPAVPAGGVKMLKALSGPFTDVTFCPTGGINLDNAPEFLALQNVICVGGSWLVPAHALSEGNWALITSLAAQACKLKRAN